MAKKTKLKLNLKYLLAGLITSGLTIWLLTQIDLGRLFNVFRHISPLWVIIGLFFYLLAYLGRAARFLILFPQGGIKLVPMFLITSVHNLYVRLLPNPFGEITFVYLAKKHLGIPSGTAVTTLLVYRLFDFFTISSLFLLAWLTKIGHLEQLSSGRIFIAISIALVVAVFLVLLGLPFLLTRFVSLTSLESKFPWLAQQVSLATSSLNQLQNFRVYTKTLLASLFLWSNMYIAYGLFIKAISFQFSIPSIIAGATLQNLINALPNLGGLGVMEIGWVAGLTLSGVEKESAIIAAFGVDGITLLGTLTLGLVCLILLNKHPETNINQRRGQVS